MSKLSNLIREVWCSLFLRELDLDCGNVSCLAFLTQYFCSDFDFCDVEFVGKEASAAHLDDVNSLGYHTAARLHGEFLTAAVELHNDRSYVTH